MLFDGDFIKHVMVSENHTKRANPNILNSSYSNCIKSFYWEKMQNLKVAFEQLSPPQLVVKLIHSVV